MHSVFRAGTRAVPNRGVLNEKNSGGQCISPPGGGRVPRALIRIPKNEGTRARDYQDRVAGAVAATRILWDNEAESENEGGDCQYPGAWFCRAFSLPFPPPSSFRFSSRSLVSLFFPLVPFFFFFFYV